MINEALSVVDYRDAGPVHINIPTTGNSAEYNCDILPKIKKIHRYIVKDLKAEYFSDYLKGKNILVIAGENYRNLSIDEHLTEFCSKFNAVCLVDYMSNVNPDDYYLGYRILETMKERDFSDLIPDIVITFGNNILSNNLK